MASTDKQAALWTIEQQPDDASIEDIIEALRYTLYIRRRIEEGLRDIEEGRVVPHEEVAREMTEWLRSIEQPSPSRETATAGADT